MTLWVIKCSLCAIAKNVWKSLTEYTVVVCILRETLVSYISCVFTIPGTQLHLHSIILILLVFIPRTAKILSFWEIRKERYRIEMISCWYVENRTKIR
jgi:hypothetical protein